MLKDIINYSREQVLAGIVDQFPESYLERALSEAGFDHFPESGITYEAFEMLQERISEIYKAETNLKPVKRKDLSSKVIETPVKIKENKKSNDYGSIVGRDLRKVGRVAGGFLGFFLSNPTIMRYAYESEGGANAKEHAGTGGFGIFSLIVHGIGGGSLYSHLFKTNPKLGAILLGIHVTTNVASGIYEYARHVKKRAIEN